MWHRKQKSALKPAHGTPLGHVSPVDGVRAGAPASPSTGGPVRREAGAYPGPGRKEGRMGGRDTTGQPCRAPPGSVRPGPCC